MIRLITLNIFVFAIWAQDGIAVVLSRDLPNKPKCALVYTDSGQLRAFVAGDANRRTELNDRSPVNECGEDISKVAVNINSDMATISFMATTTGSSLAIVFQGRVLASMKDVKPLVIEKGDIHFVIYKGAIDSLVERYVYSNLDAIFQELKVIVQLPPAIVAPPP